MAQCEGQPNLFSEDPLGNQIPPGQWNSSKVTFGALPQPGYPSALASLPDSPGNLPFCSASVSLVFSENTIYVLFIGLAHIFLWLILSHTSPSLLPLPFFGPQLRKSLLLKESTSAYFLQLHISVVWS